MYTFNVVHHSSVFYQLRAHIWNWVLFLIFRLLLRAYSKVLCKWLWPCIPSWSFLVVILVNHHISPICLCMFSNFSSTPSLPKLPSTLCSLTTLNLRLNIRIFCHFDLLNLGLIYTTHKPYYCLITVDTRYIRNISAISVFLYVYALSSSCINSSVSCYYNTIDSLPHIFTFPFNKFYYSWPASLKSSKVCSCALAHLLQFQDVLLTPLLPAHILLRNSSAFSLLTDQALPMPSPMLCYDYSDILVKC